MAKNHTKETNCRTGKVSAVSQDHVDAQLRLDLGASDDESEAPRHGRPIPEKEEEATGDRSGDCLNSSGLSGAPHAVLSREQRVLWLNDSPAGDVASAQSAGAAGQPEASADAAVDEGFWANLNPMKNKQNSNNQSPVAESALGQETVPQADVLPQQPPVVLEKDRPVSKNVYRMPPAPGVRAGRKDFNLLEYAAAHNLSARAIEYLQKTDKGPSIRPNGFSGVTTRMPDLLSLKVLTLPSRDWALAGFLTITQDPDALHVWVEGARLDLCYKTAKTTVNTCHYPDFVTIYGNRRPTMYETKPAEKLARLCIKHPTRYQEVAPGRFRSLPAEQAAAALGFDYAIISDADLDPAFLKNVRFLQMYLRWEINPAPEEAETEAIISQIESRPGITIDELKFPDSARRADLVYGLIAKRRVFVDMSGARLEDQDRVRLFVKPQQQRAFALFHKLTGSHAAQPASCPLNLREGMVFHVRKARFEIRGVKDGNVAFAGESGQLQELSMSAFMQAGPVFEHLSVVDYSLSERMRTMSDADLAIVLSRLNRAAPYLPGGDKEGRSSGDRTIRGLMKEYRELEANAPGMGLFALIPNTAARGNREPRIPQEYVPTIEEYITKEYLNKKRRLSVVKLRRMINRHFMENGVSFQVTYSMLAARCRAKDRHLRDVMRKGVRFGKDTEIPTEHQSFFGSPNGVKPYETVHIDATLRDVAMHNSDPKKRIQKVWHYKMVDSATNEVLAWVNTPNHPSTDSLIEVLRDCVRRHRTLPVNIVVDWGADYRSTWMQKTLASFRVIITYRRKGDGKSGSPVENSFNTDNKRLIHCLSGATDLMKHARKVTKNSSPTKYSIWRLSDLDKQTEEYYNKYNTTYNETWKCSPAERRKEMCRTLGNHPAMCIPDELLKRLLLPFVKGLSRKVDDRGRILWNGKHYACEELGAVRGEYVDVRHDPDDRRVLYVTHRKLNGLVECPVVSLDMKYADDRQDANVISFNAMQRDLAKEDEADRKWSEFDASVEENEERLRALARKPTRKPKAPRVSEPIEEDDSSLSAGGFINLRDEEA